MRHRLRETDTAGCRVLFRAELGAGAHTGPSAMFARLAYEADVQAFVLDAMRARGLTTRPAAENPAEYHADGDAEHHPRHQN